MSSSPVSWNPTSFAGASSVTVASAVSRSLSSRGGNSPSGSSWPSRRSTGGCPILRWMSLAPSSTARRRTELSSTRPTSARVRAALSSSEGLHEPKRCAHEPVRVGGALDLAADELLEERPDERQPRDGEGEPREAVERELRLPRAARQAVERRVERTLVRLELVPAAGEDVECRVRGEPCADRRLVDAVSRERVDESRRVADEQRPAGDDAVSGPPHRQAEPAQVRQIALVDAVEDAEAAQLLAPARPSALPASDADVDVLGLREDPAVAAGDGTELEQRTATKARAGDRRVPSVALVGDAVAATVCEAERPRRHAVDAVGADDDLR